MFLLSPSIGALFPMSFLTVCRSSFGCFLWSHPCVWTWHQWRSHIWWPSSHYPASPAWWLSHTQCPQPEWTILLKVTGYLIVAWPEDAKQVFPQMSGLDHASNTASEPTAHCAPTGQLMFISKKERGVTPLWVEMIAVKHEDQHRSCCSICMCVRTNTLHK